MRPFVWISSLLLGLAFWGLFLALAVGVELLADAVQPLGALFVIGVMGLLAGVAWCALEETER